MAANPSGSEKLLCKSAVSGRSTAVSQPVKAGAKRAREVCSVDSGMEMHRKLSTALDVRFE